MKASTLLPLFIQGTIIFAQSLSGLPACAQTAAIQGASASGCGVTDAACLCNNAGFISSLKATISGSCTGSDQQAACAWGNSACAAYGASIDCSVYAAAVSSGGTTTPPAASVGSSSGTASISNTGTDPMTSSTTKAGTGNQGPTSSISTTSVSGPESQITSMMSMTTSTTHHGNETMSCTHSCGNHTIAAPSMVSKTASAPTSQYTGAANTAARHCGVIGILAGVALLGAFL